MITHLHVGEKTSRVSIPSICSDISPDTQLNVILKPVLEALPMSLVETRQYTSSLPSNLPRKTIYIPQIQSTLLGKLPAEIRLKIWRYAIGNQEIHIISKYRRLGHAVCDEEYWAENQAERPGLRASSYMFTFGSLQRTKQLADWSMVNLLRTCQLVYVISLLSPPFPHRSTYPKLLPLEQYLRNDHATLAHGKRIEFTL